MRLTRDTLEHIIAHVNDHQTLTTLLRIDYFCAELAAKHLYHTVRLTGRNVGSFLLGCDELKSRKAVYLSDVRVFHPDNGSWQAICAAREHNAFLLPGLYALRIDCSMLYDPSFLHLDKMVPALRHLTLNYDLSFTFDMSRLHLLPALQLLEKLSIHDATACCDQSDRLGKCIGAGNNQPLLIGEPRRPGPGLIFPPAWSKGLKELEIWPPLDDSGWNDYVDNPFDYMPVPAALSHLTAFTVRICGGDEKYPEKAVDCITRYDKSRTKLSAQQQAIVRYKHGRVRIDEDGARSWDCDGK